ncbi:hypothetical protein F511_33011 [Dorcoceras hygrometricum]|uniref:Uncharacterized protein n=1 Tax=Dorcoceras hygrometricum TaxID=472368 RepID=A0A2Z7CD18_9LAMI|nr:hypothetical protein F511_33011 [Dorcoceras hygrometricum]
MEHTGRARMFKTLEDIGLTGFLAASSSVYESVVVEFFANAKVIVGTIVSFVANKKLALMKETFAEAFGLPTEVLDVPSQTVVEMRGRFSGSDLPFRAPSKKKEMKIEFCLLHDIVAKALCANTGSFDMVNIEKFNLMVAITAGLKVNWAHVLFQLLVAMVHNPSRQSQGFAVQLSVLLECFVKVHVTKKHRTKRTRRTTHTNDQAESQPNPISDIPAGYDKGSTDGGPEANTETTTAMETRAGDESAAGGPEGHVGTTPETEGRVDDATQRCSVVCGVASRASRDSCDFWFDFSTLLAGVPARA